MLSRLLLEAEDLLRYRPEAREVFCRMFLAAEQAPPLRRPRSYPRSLRLLFKAITKAPSDAIMRQMERRIEEQVRHLDLTRLDWDALYPLSAPREIGKAALLKAPVGSDEKGVLFLTFEFQLLRLLRHANLRRLAERYTLVFLPSYSPPHNLILYLFPQSYPDQIFTLISNRRDLEVLPRISSSYKVVPLYASSWVNPELYQPLPFEQRDIDLLMVAGFSKAKRHHALFKALRSMPRSVKVTLIGQSCDGRDSNTLFAEAASYGVQDRFLLVENPLIDAAPLANYQSVVRAFCRAKTSAILSLQEGSCIVIAESMFADTPVAVLQNAEVGSKAFINEATGRLLDPQHVSEQLTEFVAQARTYSPRRWAVENISCLKSTQVLNDLLKRHALESGRPWTVDIAPIFIAPEPHYLREADARRLAPSLDDFQREVGVPIKMTPFNWA